MYLLMFYLSDIFKRLIFNLFSFYLLLVKMFLVLNTSIAKIRLIIYSLATLYYIKETVTRSTQTVFINRKK